MCAVVSPSPLAAKRPSQAQANVTRRRARISCRSRWVAILAPHVSVRTWAVTKEAIAAHPLKSGLSFPPH